MPVVNGLAESIRRGSIEDLVCVASMATKKPIDLRRERATALDKFVRLATKALNKQPKLRSVVLHSRQSVMSEMGDAIVGPGRNPVLLQATCTPPISDSLSFLEDGAGFAAMLDPDDYDFGIARGPLAIVERVPGAIRAAWIGAPLRPRLDLPAASKLVKQAPLTKRAKDLYQRVLAEPTDLEARSVLRDAWLESGDARGEFSALTLAPSQTDAMRARAAAIVLEHGRSWLGKLQSIIPVSGALFGPGPFLRKAIVFLANERAWRGVERAQEWATVEELVFADGSHRALSPAMKNLRSVGPIYAEQLGVLANGTWLVTELDVAVGFDPRGTLKQLAKLALPLTHLRLRAEKAIDLAPLAKASWWSSLERIELWLPERTTDPVDAMIAAFTKLAKRAPCTVAVGVLAHEQRTGYMITGTARARTLELHQPDLRHELGAELAKRLRKKAPTAWQPSDLDWLPLGFGVPVASGTSRSLRVT